MSGLNVKIAVAALAVTALFTLNHLTTVGGLKRQLAQARQEARAAKDAHKTFVADLLRQTAPAVRCNADSVSIAM